MNAILKAFEATLRPLHEADLDAIMAIEGAVYEFPWTLGIFRDCLRVGYSCWGVDDGSELIAYGVMSAGGGEAHVLNICVRPDYQHRGIGTRLLLHLKALARKRHAETLLLEVRQSNRAAIQLYHAHGFNEVGTRPRYYPAREGREDALILACSLLDEAQ